MVAGASVAGLLAARALREHVGEVLVLDRDVLPSGVRPRRGVPQGRHPHVVPAGGYEAIERLLPGFHGELAAAGAVKAGAATLLSSRPLFERTLRRRIERLDGVRIAGSSEVTGVLTDAGRSRVTGVTVASGGRLGAIEDIDLLVDATGRASRTPAWLAALGLDPVPEESVELGLTYVSQRFRASGAPSEILADGRCVLAQEGNTVLVSGNVTPPGEPIGAPATLRFPRAFRRYYERIDVPGNLVVLGDAMCTLDPRLRQGVTVAARQAELLTDPVRDNARPQCEAAALLETPWRATAAPKSSASPESPAA